MKCGCGHLVFSRELCYFTSLLPTQRVVCPMCYEHIDERSVTDISCDFCGAPLSTLFDAPEVWKEEDNGYVHLALACADCAAQEHKMPENGNNPPFIVALDVEIATVVELFAQLLSVELQNEYTLANLSSAMRAKKEALWEDDDYDYSELGTFNLYPDKYMPQKGIYCRTNNEYRFWWMQQPAWSRPRDMLQALFALYPPEIIYNSDRVCWNVDPSTLNPDRGYLIACIGREELSFRRHLIKFLDNAHALGIVEEFKAAQVIERFIWKRRVKSIFDED